MWLNINYNTDKITGQRVLWHVIFWLSYYVFYAAVNGAIEHDNHLVFRQLLVLMPLRIITAYFTIYVLLPRIFNQRKYFQFAILFLNSAIVAGVLQQLHYRFLIIPWLYPKDPLAEAFYLSRALKGLFNLYSIVAIAAAIKLIKQWYYNLQTTKELINKNLEAELKLLKAQIHPHFLFNTLNNLYALCLKKSDAAPDVVLKLSELLNYMLYECNAATVSVEKELYLINNYIDLERIRYGKRLSLIINMPETGLSMQIAPMLLLPFIENAFKHGVSNNLDNPWIRVNVEITNNRLFFNVANSCEESDRNKEASFREGIGLTNVRKRLQMLYPYGSKLEIKETENSFEASLTIETDKLVMLN